MTYVYVLALLGTIAVFTPIIIVLVVKRIKIELKKRKYTEKGMAVIEDTPMFYEKVLYEKQLVDKQDNIDLAILLAILNNSDLNNIIGIFGISIQSLQRATNYQSMEKGPDVENSHFKDQVREKVESAIKLCMGTRKQITPEVIFLAMEASSDIFKNFIKKAQNIETFEDDIQTKSVSPREFKFYNHAYPEDSKAKSLRKKTLQ